MKVTTLSVVLFLSMTGLTGCNFISEDAKGQHGTNQKRPAQIKETQQANKKVGDLALAAAKGDTAEVQALLAAGYDVNQANEYGSTVLMTAAATGQAEVVRALLNFGAKVNAQQKDSKLTPLLFAVWNVDNTDVVRALIESGADLEAKDRSGDTALIIAARKGRVSSLNALIAAGANVNARSTQNGTTALMAAAALNDSSDRVPANRIAIVKALLTAGADVNAKQDNGHTALMFAAIGGHTAVTRTLVEAGADVNARNVDGDSALALAERNKQNAIVQELKGITSLE